jgi:hypothetical protein
MLFLTQEIEKVFRLSTSYSHLLQGGDGYIFQVFSQQRDSGGA